MLQQFLYDNLRGSENLVDKGWVSLTAWMTLDAHMSPHRSGYDAK